MQSLPDLTCADCGKQYSSASCLLQHFAEHVYGSLHDNQQNETIPKKSKIPDLYPVNIKKRHVKVEINEDLSDENIAKYCEVAIIEDVKAHVSLNKHQQHNFKRNYQCLHCAKRFGWSTDLKRHILVHTGERPFKCNYCSSSFTRNFILQKHLDKLHNNGSKKSNIPDLKPILTSTQHKSRKQDKFKIKRNSFESTQANNSVDVFLV